MFNGTAGIRVSSSSLSFAVADSGLSGWLAGAALAFSAATRLAEPERVATAVDDDEPPPPPPPGASLGLTFAGWEKRDCTWEYLLRGVCGLLLTPLEAAFAAPSLGEDSSDEMPGGPPGGTLGVLFGGCRGDINGSELAPPAAGDACFGTAVFLPGAIPGGALVGLAFRIIATTWSS